MNYLALKYMHVTCVGLSALGFMARGIGVLLDTRWIGARWVRVVPHVVDSVLLASAVGLAATLGVAPGRDAWLTAKVVALIAYIVLGSFALRRGRTRKEKAAAFAAALLVFGYIVSVALTRNPQPWH